MITTISTLKHRPGRGNLGTVLKRAAQWARSSVTLLLLLASLTSSVSAQNVIFTDPNLEAAVLKALQKNQEPVSLVEMQRLTTLNASSRGITNLTGLESAVNLQTLILNANFSLTDVTLLSGLVKLTHLEIGQIGVSDLNPLRNLTGLTVLYVGGNLLSDLSPLGGLHVLQELNLSWNQISDLHPLSGLTALRALDLYGNPLSGSALAPLESLGELQKLNLGGMGISDFPWITPDSLPKLTEFDCSGSWISSLSFLDHFPLLTSLAFEYNGVSNLSPVGRHPLVFLNCTLNEITDISVLQNMASLTAVRMAQNYLDVSPDSSSGQVIEQLSNRGVAVESLPQKQLPTPPNLDALPARFAFAGQPLQLALAAGDANRAAEIASVVASSSDQILLPDGAMLISGSGASRTLTLTPAAGRSGTATVTLTVSYSGGEPSSASGSFTITVLPVNGSMFIREVYENIPGTSVSKLPLWEKMPTFTGTLNTFETPQNSGDNYGQRVYGYLVPPVSGEYVFYLASDDDSVLLLSTSSEPAHKVQIASLTGWSPSRQWTSAPRSTPIYLEAGRPYYIEALHKEGGGGDNLAVTWQLPGAATPANGDPALPQLPPGAGSLADKFLFVQQTEISGSFLAGDLNRANEILSVAATSSDQGVVPEANITLLGSGLVRQIQVTAGMNSGITTITVTTRYSSGPDSVGRFQVTVIGSEAFFIEAEDFDFGAGQHQSLADVMPYAGGAYAGMSAVSEVDYHKNHSAPEPDTYRLNESPAVGLIHCADSNRGTYVLANDFNIGWNNPGEWYNYTRNFQPGNYHIYARLASGAADENAQLDRVTGGLGTTLQTLSPLGSFIAPATGKWELFGLVPLRTSGGALASVTLSGQQTLRFTSVHGGADPNYFVLVPATSVFFADNNLEAAVLAALLKSQGPVSPEEMQGLITLNASSRGITDLTGLESAVNLQTLILNANFSLTDITPLSGLTQLTRLDLGQTGISDLGALTKLKTLISLSAGGNPSLNLATLPALENLEDLDISWDQITNIQPVSQMTKLRSLNLYGNWLDHPEALTALEPLSQLQTLIIGRVGISNFSFITKERFPNLTEFVCSGNAIGDLSFLANFPQLTRLDFENNFVADLSPIAVLKNLEFLNCTFNEVQDISLLNTLTTLQAVRMAQNYLDVSPDSSSGQVIVQLLSLRVAVESLPQKLPTPPNLDSLPARFAFAGQPLQLALAAGDANRAAEIASVVASSSDQILLPDGAMLISGSGASRTLTLTPVAGQSGTATVTLTVNYSSGQPSIGSFAITVLPINGSTFIREVYENIPGTSVSKLPLWGKMPNFAETLTTFETPQNSGDNYGQRVYGYLLPPVSGEYAFYLASDDDSVLYLSTDSEPAHKLQIAALAGWSPSRQWTSAPRSSPIYLEAGRPYYIEALHKEGGGGDNLAVTWQLPGNPAPPNGTAPLPELPGLVALKDKVVFAGHTGSSGTFDVRDPNRSATIVSVTASTSDPAVVPQDTLSVVGDDLARQVQFTAGVKAGTATIAVTAEYSSGAETTASFQVMAIGPDALFIEAEDFDFGAGQYQPTAEVMPYAGGAYEGQSAVPDVDYHKNLDAPIPQIYRLGEAPSVGIIEYSDLNRGTYNVEKDLSIGWNGINEWYNYTRNLSPGLYQVYARLASGGLDGRARFDQVTSGFGTSSQSLGKLGEFSASATGQWHVFGLVPLRREGGELATVFLSGLNTLRYTLLEGNADPNYFVLAPCPPTGPAPNVLAVNMLSGSDAVVVSFDQSIDAVSAVKTGSYQISGASVTGVTMLNDRKVLLQLGGFTGTSLTLAVNGIFGLNGAQVSKAATTYSVSPWHAADIGAEGDPIQPGAAYTLGAGAFEVTAGGSDIWDTADHFHFVYQAWTGDFDMQVQVAQLTAAQAFAKAALMVRQDLSAASAEVNVNVTPATGVNAYQAEMRLVRDGSSQNWQSLAAEPPLFPNAWLRLKRQGSTFAAFYGTDGVNWVKFADLNRAFSDLVYVGLATTAHLNEPGQVARASYRQLAVSRPSALLRVDTIDAFASEAGADPGLFRISLSGDRSTTATVQFSLGGTARPGLDYELPSTTVTIPAGRDSVTVPIKPIPNQQSDGYRTVELHLLPLAGAEIGNSTATAGLFDDNLIPNALQREIYDDVFGVTLADLESVSAFPYQPSRADLIGSFESKGSELNYGERLSGYLLPPRTGDYVFYIAADDQAALWLSTDANPAHKQMIAIEPSWNASRDWTGTERRDASTPENRSSAITLQAGQSYYVEVLHQQGIGDSHVAVAWQFLLDEQPPANGAEPIPGQALAIRVPLSIAALNPVGVQSGGADFTLSVMGAGFVPGAVVQWNNSPCATTYISPRGLAVTIPASAIVSSSEIRTATITVVNPGGELSNPTSFTIGSAAVAMVESTIAPPGATVVVSTAPIPNSGAGEAGVAATFNNTDTSSPVTVTAATYSSNPDAGTLFDTGAGFVDLQVTGAHPSDSMTADFYYPLAVSDSTEQSLVLLYFDGTSWNPVLSSGGGAPVKDTTDNLDGTVSGGRFSVRFDDSSTPRITALGGTVFAATREDIAGDREPPVPDKDPLPLIRGLYSVTINTAPTATDSITGKVTGHTEDPLIYTRGGTYTVHWTYNDGNGNIAQQDQTVVVVLPEFRGFSAPIGGADQTGGSLEKPLRTFKLGSTVPVKFTLACSGVPDLTAGIHTLEILKDGKIIQGLNSETGNRFRLSDTQWILNLGTKTLTRGTFKLVVHLADGRTHVAWIKLQ